MVSQDLKARVRCLAFSAIFLCIALPLGGLVQAQGADSATGGESAADARASSFRAVEGSDAEQVPGGSLLIGAYGVMWLFVFGYVWRLQKIHGQTREDIRRLELALAGAEQSGKAGGDSEGPEAGTDEADSSGA